LIKNVPHLYSFLSFFQLLNVCVKYDEDQLEHINPRVSGWIEKLYIKASGDPVKQGEPLYSLYSPELVNAQEELVMALPWNERGPVS
jgi:Cu(I)/Ag(I) efflux system membrane fusion protein